MAINNLVDEFGADIQITRARYAELLLAERDANLFKNLLVSKNRDYDSVTPAEIKMLRDMFCVGEVEADEEL